MGLDGLRRHQREIDDLNVYPVPDGDTGTNLVLTVAAADEALALEADALASLGHALRCAARGALLGARGNSGVILSQILRGLADALAAAPLAGGRALATALATAASAAYQAVAQPVEGTILTVVRAAAQAAAAADSDDLATVARAAADAARAALARTPEQLPVLARAGVVDAGGRGLCVMLDALVEVITGERPSDEPVVPASVRPPLTMARESGSDDYAYEVQFLLDATETAVAPLKQSLAKLGDSLVVVGGDGTWNVHVHVNDVGAAVEAGVEAGRPHRITVTRSADRRDPGGDQGQRRPLRGDPAQRPQRRRGSRRRGGRGARGRHPGRRGAQSLTGTGARGAGRPRRGPPVRRRRHRHGRGGGRVPVRRGHHR